MCQFLQNYSWRFVCGEIVWVRDDRKPFCFTSVSSLPDPVVQRFVRTETVFVILILRLLILFQVQES